MEKIEKYQQDYSEKGFWKKIAKTAGSIGRTIIDKALILFYTFKDPETPDWVKTIIIGTLGYFIIPLDIIPDLTPLAGYSDDLAALLAAIGTVSKFIKRDHVEQAIKTSDNLFK